MLETLVAENGTPQTTPRGSLAHRLRFRKLVLAVLAANRLRRLGKVRRSVSIRDGETQNNLQCWMTADCNGNTFLSISLHIKHITYTISLPKVLWHYHSVSGFWDNQSGNKVTVENSYFLQPWNTSHCLKPRPKRSLCPCWNQGYHHSISQYVWLTYL